MYIADLHIHSKYSRATSRDCTPEHLDLWARRKGIDLIGTGDFTHPAWRAELKEKLTPAEEGLYILRENMRIKDSTAIGANQTRFVVSGEISSIYKKNGKVRKVHNLILLPSLEAADVLSHKLELIGNIHSDGRPILGLDSRDLLEITLQSCPEAVFIPAHIWTPHFSLFGAFSGFDTIEECFEDLTPHIHALETGLSSDPPMNWRISALDRFNLVSNSDAHSPQKLGREANLIHTDLSYPALSNALQGGRAHGFAGTIEFFPEEGKYHFDGHRACKLCLTPAQADELGGKCPVCGKKITIGVQHRVEQLADREEGFILPDAPSFQSLVPLPEVIAASTGRSAASVKTAALYDTMLRQLGSEFYILRNAPLEEIEHAAGPCIREGIRRLRMGEVQRDPGYDGAYGVIHLLEQSEIETLNGQISLFKAEPSPKTKAPSIKKQIRKTEGSPQKVFSSDENTVKEKNDILAGLNEEQLTAVTVPADSTVSVIAGPGTGKTKTLISRIVYLVQHCGVSPKEITAVTFTNKAAGEIRERLEKEFKSKRTAHAVTVGTFHSICLNQLSKGKNAIALIDQYAALEKAAAVIREQNLKISSRQFLREISMIKNGGRDNGTQLTKDAYSLYCKQLQQAEVLDFDDLLINTLTYWEENTAKNKQDGTRFTHLLVDEFQDINDIQYRLISTWGAAGKSLFVIGDPDQSIYGFRGSSAQCFDRLKNEFSSLKTIRLIKNYRSAPNILDCALSLISKNSGEKRLLEPQKHSSSPVSLITADSDLSEAIFIAKEINHMVGGIDMLDAQHLSGKERAPQPRSFSDFAVLYRTHRQARILEKCLRRESIPYIVAGRDDLLSDEIVRGTLGFFRFLCNTKDVLSLRFCLKTIWGCPADIIDSFVHAWDNDGGSACLTMERLEKITASFSNVGYLQKCLEFMLKYLPRLKKDKPLKLLEDWAQDNRLSDSQPMNSLINMTVFYKDMPSFLQNVLLGQEGDLLRCAGRTYSSDTVKLMTLHGAKGLEFPTVFLCGVKDGCIPLQSTIHPSDTEEERRLFFVGMTRAKEELFLITSSNPSQFIAEIPQNKLMRASALVQKPMIKGTQLSLFD